MGKPAARKDDLTESGGPIIQGSATVLIGDSGGIACSTCPGGKKIGKPVNPTLGAKVLLGPEDMDFALPGPMPLVWQRVCPWFFPQSNVLLFSCWRLQ